MRPSTFPHPSRPRRRSFRAPNSEPVEPPDGPAQISILVNGSLDTHLLVAVSGEVDLATVGELELPLLAALAAGCRHLIVDLSALTFCGAAGLGVFARVRDAFDHAGRTFAPTGPSGPLTRYLNLVGLSSLISPSIPRQFPRHVAGIAQPQQGACRSHPADGRLVPNC